MIGGGRVKNLDIDAVAILDLSGVTESVSLLVASGTTLTATGTLRVLDSTETVTLASQTAGTAFTYTGTDIDYNAKGITLRDIDATGIAAGTAIESGAAVTIEGTVSFLNIVLDGELNMAASAQLNSANVTATASSAITNTGPNTIVASGNVSIQGTFNSPENSTLVMTGMGVDLDALPQIGNLKVGVNLSETPAAITAAVTLARDLSLDGSLEINAEGSLSVGVGNHNIELTGTGPTGSAHGRPRTSMTPP
jgi:hypothetical protein